MKKDISYVQCFLEKKDGLTVKATVTYLPDSFSKINSIVDLKMNDDTWDRGWKVIKTGDVTKDIPNWKGAIKAHRKNTGDSINKS